MSRPGKLTITAIAILAGLAMATFGPDDGNAAERGTAQDSDGAVCAVSIEPVAGVCAIAIEDALSH